jgi:hypothetical protein
MELPLRNHSASFQYPLSILCNQEGIRREEGFIRFIRFMRFMSEGTRIFYFLEVHKLTKLNELFFTKGIKRRIRVKKESMPNDLTYPLGESAKIGGWKLY